MLAVSKVKMGGEGALKKKPTGTQATDTELSFGEQYDISYIICVTRRSHVVVMPSNVKEMYKYSVLHVQSCFCFIRPIVFLPSTLPSLFSVTRFYLFFE